MKLIRWMIIAVLTVIVSMAVFAQESELDLPILQNGEAVEDSFEGENVSHLYAFYASAGDVVSIAMSQDSDDLDPFLVLLDSEGAVLAYDDDSGSTRLAALIQNFEIEDDGIYFVLASSLNYIEGTVTEVDDELAYQVRAIGQTTPESVDDDSIVSVELNSLQLGDTENAESSADNPVVIYLFEGQAGDSLDLSIDTGNSFFSVLYVFAPDGSLIGIDPSSLSLELEEDGIYVIIATDAAFYEANEDNGYFEGGEFQLTVGS